MDTEIKSRLAILIGSMWLVHLLYATGWQTPSWSVPLFSFPISAGALVLLLWLLSKRGQS